MFQIRDNQVWYKTNEMVDWILYGMLYSANFVAQEGNLVTYEVQKFNVESGLYEKTTELDTFEYLGTVYTLIDGTFQISLKEPPEPEPTMNERIYEAVSKSQDEIRQEGADMVMEELVKRGLIV